MMNWVAASNAKVRLSLDQRRHRPIRRNRPSHLGARASMPLPALSLHLAFQSMTWAGPWLRLMLLRRQTLRLVARPNLRGRAMIQTNEKRLKTLQHLSKLTGFSIVEIAYMARMFAQAEYDPLPPEEWGEPFEFEFP